VDKSISLGVYYGAAIPRAFAAGWDWAIGQGLLLTFLLSVSAVICASLYAVIRGMRRSYSWSDARKRVWRAIVDFVIGGFGAIVIGLTFLFVVFFIRDAPNQLATAHKEITNWQTAWEKQAASDKLRFDELHRQLEVAKQPANFSFTFPYMQRIAEESVDVSITVRNETQSAIEIEEIRIVRMFVQDDSPFVDGEIKNWCKLINVSPQVSRMPPYRQTLFQPPPGGPSAGFEYLDNTKIIIDGVDKPTTQNIIDPGKHAIYNIAAKGKFKSLEFGYKPANGVVLCPVIVYVDKDRHGIACPGVGSFTDPQDPNHNATWTETTRFPLRDPGPDDRCSGLKPL
jgi:hypothetical protein